MPNSDEDVKMKPESLALNLACRATQLRFVCCVKATSEMATQDDSEGLKEENREIEDQDFCQKIIIKVKNWFCSLNRDRIYFEWTPKIAFHGLALRICNPSLVQNLAKR